MVVNPFFSPSGIKSNNLMKLFFIMFSLFETLRPVNVFNRIGIVGFVLRLSIGAISLVRCP